MTEGRRLVLLRHAKAEQQHHQGDFERGLTPRGRRDAAEAGRFLAAAGTVPDHALVSAAMRTRQTWGEIAAASGSDAEPDLDRSLYNAYPEALLEAVHLAPAEARVVILVGHNPATEVVASALVDESVSDPEALASMAPGMPTSALCVFEVDGDWADVVPGSLRLKHFHLGRG